MSALLLDLPRRTEDEYFALDDASSEKHELVDGLIIAMAGGEPLHSYVANNVQHALTRCLRRAGSRCRVFQSDLRVGGFDDFYTYPDITVVCGRPVTHPKSRTTIINPTLVVEILSAGTEAWDRGGKFERYRRSPSLRDYVMVSVRERTVEHHRREPSGEWVLAAAQERGLVALPALGIELDVAELFAGVDELARELESQELQSAELESEG